MGCSSSTPVHPSIYNELIKKKPVSNGEVKEKAPVEEINSRNMKGDYSQFQLAKHNREKHHKDRQIKLFMAADEMSGKVIEDREMLSLGTRSRGTSRNTSRATSPTGNKRGHPNDQMAPMTPVAEDKLSRVASLKSLDNGNVQSEITPKKKQKTHKQSKSKAKTKKRKKGKKTKKGKLSKGIDESDKEELDSGLEDEKDDNDDHSEADSDKENATDTVTVKVTSIDNRQNKKLHNNKEGYTAGNTKIGENVTVLPLADESVNITQKVETPLMSNRSVRDIKIQSASKDSGIAESGINDSPKITPGNGTTNPIISENNPDLQPEERSDSRI